MNNYREIRHFHLCCGLGGGASGFNRGQARKEFSGEITYGKR